MIPAGYLIKRTVPPLGWLQPNASNIAEVCSVSDCVNDDVVDLLDSWKFNNFGFANTKEILLELAQSSAVDLSDTSLFFYYVYERELGSDGWKFDPEGWRKLTLPDISTIENGVVAPECADRPVLLGYDVVVCGDFPEHSPLSCNLIATELPVNQFCLFDDFDAAKAAINAGKFGGGCGEGFYRIMSVCRVEGWYD